MPDNCIPAPPKFLVGTDNFKKFLLQSNIFVDKSLFIKNVIEDSGDVILITRPRRWGKSINMDMLRYFLEIEVDEHGNRLESKNCINSKFFCGGELDLGLKSGAKKVLPPLKISKYEDIIENYQGEYPVINISFKEVKGESYDEIMNGVKEQITKLFLNSSFLKKYLEPNNNTLATVEKNRLSRYYDGTPNLEDIKVSLQFLSGLFSKHFHRNSYILIDEYDTPINTAYINFGDKPEFKSVTNLFSGIFSSALKGNEFLEKGVITGILRIAKANIFSGINNISECCLLDKKFSKSYGFTQEEVDELISHLPYPNLSEDIKKWYNGYTYGGEVVYNPWSVMQCLANEGTIDAYWIDSGNTGLIDKTLLSDDMQPALQKLVSGEDIILPITKHIDFNEIDEPDSLYSLLLFSGYLNAHVVDFASKVYALSIPNEEVKYIYEKRILKWLTKQLNTKSNIYYSFINLLADGKIDEFKEQFQEFLQNATSMHQVGKKKAELFYNAFMLCLISILSPNFIIDSERESGKGRPDVVLISKPDRGNIALIIEYKISKTLEELISVAQNGLNQINAKNYDAKIKESKHIKQIIKISMAFCGKELDMKYNIDSL